MTMKAAKVLSVALVPGALSQYPTPTGKTQINDPDLIDAYNAANDATWVAGHNDYFNGMTFDDARPILGTVLSHISEHLNNTLPDSLYATMGEAPAAFDARDQWKELVHPIRDQAHCGSCWAFSASEVLSDRVAIASKKPSPVLSPEDMVSCDKSDMGCKGGRLSSAWSYLKNTGIVTDKCFPYGAGGGNAPACATKCADSESFTRQKVSSDFAINGVANMQKEMATNGPIQVAFLVYKSFMSYQSGVYTKHMWEFLPEGGHAVKMLGWGTESGTDYWLVANSWGTTKWGKLGGYFKIKRGTNECGIETQGPPYAGLPALSKSAELKEDFVKGGTLKLSWSDCGAAHGKVTGISPNTLTLGTKTTVTGSGSVQEDVTGGTFEIGVKAWPISKTYSGNLCEAKTFDMPMGVGTVKWDGLSCPVKAGAVKVGTDIQMSASLPSSLAKATISIKGKASNGDDLLCMNIQTAPAEAIVV